MYVHPSQKTFKVVFSWIHSRFTKARIEKKVFANKLNTFSLKMITKHFHQNLSIFTSSIILHCPKTSRIFIENNNVKIHPPNTLQIYHFKKIDLKEGDGDGGTVGYVCVQLYLHGYRGEISERFPGNKFRWSENGKSEIHEANQVNLILQIRSP